MAGPREIELKLDVPATQMTRLRQLPLVKRAGWGKRETLRSVYFDTDKHKLRKRGVSLRIRHEGDRRVRTTGGPQFHSWNAPTVRVAKFLS